MNIEKTEVKKVVEIMERGVRIDLTFAELQLLLHFITCRNDQEHCAGPGSGRLNGGYDDCVTFALDFVDKIQRARVW